MAYEKFEVGDRVEFVYDYHTANKGDVGTVSMCEAAEIVPSSPGESQILHIHLDDGRAVGAAYERRVKRHVPKTAVPAPAAAGRKDDSGKLDMTLLDDMPRAIAAVVEVMQWAVKDKQPVPYERGSWLGVDADRYRAAIKRHDADAAKQYSSVPIGTVRPLVREQRDPETNLLHLAHMACSALMALENTLRELETKK